MDPAAPLATPQTAHASLAGGGRRAEADLRVTPAGLLAIGALVCGILLAVPPIIRAAGAVAGARK